MEKRALSSNTKTILKILGGVGIAGGAAGAGAYKGYRVGADRMADSMSSEFLIQNQAENQSIIDSFKRFNETENKRLTNNAFMKGVQYAMDKSSSLKEQFIADAFVDEFQKIAGKVGGKLPMDASLLKKILIGLGVGAGLGATGYGIKKMSSFQKIAGKAVAEAAAGSLLKKILIGLGGAAALGAGGYGIKKAVSGKKKV